MRKIILSLLVGIFISLTITNCASGKNQMNDALSKVYVGMPISEFNKVFPKKELVKLEDGISIYKVTKRVWYDSDGSGSSYRYFYFRDNKLAQIDKGVRKVDKRIRIDKN